jgi:hypothetical protein
MLVNEPVGIQENAFQDNVVWKRSFQHALVEEVGLSPLNLGETSLFDQIGPDLKNTVAAGPALSYDELMT